MDQTQDQSSGRTAGRQAGPDTSPEDTALWLAAVVKSSDDAIISKTLDGVITSWNTAAQHIYGYSAEEVIGKSISLLIPAERLDEFKQIMRRLRQGKRIDHFETVRVCRDGRRIDVSITISPIIDAHGQIIGASTIARDITERKHAEIERMRIAAELTEAQQRLSESREAERLHLAQELHDGPVQDLYGVRFQLGELVESADGANINLVSVAEVQMSVQRVIGTLRAICGELRSPALAPFGLEVALRSHAAHFRETYPDLAVSLDLSTDGLDVPERVRLALFRIYQQALNNVAQHAQAQTVLVQLAADAEQIVLTVQDDGCGFVVPASWLELARQGHMGLLGAAERAEAIGGQLDVETAVGAGTTVYVCIPLPTNANERGTATDDRSK